VRPLNPFEAQISLYSVGIDTTDEKTLEKFPLRPTDSKPQTYAEPAAKYGIIMLKTTFSQNPF
jgi:hypothetical protein